MKAPQATVPALLALLCCAGCTRVTNDMANQPRYNPWSRSPLFADDQATRPPVTGGVPHASGDLAAVSSARRGVLSGEASPQPASSDALLARGHERYAIYCLPCHGARGDGDGRVVRRGFPAPLSFAVPSQRAAPDAQIHDAILRGAGIMYPFADRVSPADAWAIVAYVRQLQGEHPRVATVPAAMPAPSMASTAPEAAAAPEASEASEAPAAPAAPAAGGAAPDAGGAR